MDPFSSHFYHLQSEQEWLCIFFQINDRLTENILERFLEKNFSSDEFPL